MNEKSLPKILIIDDEPYNVSLMEAYLSLDYDTTGVLSGEDALEMIKTDDFDLVILDIMMPGLSGYEVCKILKNDVKTKFIPVIMATALFEKGDQIRSIEAGADDFLSKPVDQIELKTRVRSLIKVKRLSDNLISERDQAQRYLDIAGVIMVVIDPDQKVSLINRRGCEVLGRSEEEVVGKNWFEVSLPISEQQQTKDVFDNLMSGNGSEYEYNENQIVIKNGDLRVISWQNRIINDDHGNITGVLSSGEDVTEERCAKKELEHSNELKDLFIDILRHDMLNTAGVVKGFTEVLLKRVTDDPQLEMLRTIKRNNIKMIGLIQNAARFAKLESIDHLQLQSINLCPILNEVVDSFSKELDKKQMNIEMIGGDSCQAMVDPVIEEVFFNFISNAIKYGPEKSTIRIEGVDSDDKWVISVCDQGEGISGADKSLIFERFIRVNKTNIKGTGLGLAIVKRIMDLHEGEFGVKDNPEGKGSVFWVSVKKA
ncbi:MAG: response regulator [Methanosarcinaceae archaeon]|nr:response regulator [Methanosarcinaceae archaeon]